MIKYDEEKVKLHKDFPNKYRVRYRFCRFDDPLDLKLMKKVDHSVCFSSFFERYRKVEDDKDAVMVLFESRRYETDLVLKFTQVRRWITLCKKHKLIPKHINYKNAITKDNGFFNVLFKLKVKDVPVGRIYHQLSSMRDLVEEFYVIRAALYLHDELGVPFLPSYHMANCFNREGGGHSITTFWRLSSWYHKNGKLTQTKTLTKNSKICMNTVRALYKFLNKEDLFRGKKLTKGSIYWECSAIINALALTEIDNKMKMAFPIGKLDDERVPEIISTYETKKAYELFKEVIK